MIRGPLRGCRVLAAFGISRLCLWIDSEAVNDRDSTANTAASAVFAGFFGMIFWHSVRFDFMVHSR
jgi:hypothetical protein